MGLGSQWVITAITQASEAQGTKGGNRDMRSVLKAESTLGVQCEKKRGIQAASKVPGLSNSYQLVDMRKTREERCLEPGKSGVLLRAVVSKWPRLEVISV